MLVESSEREERFLNELRRILDSQQDKWEAIRQTMELVRNSRDDYHWVGVYFFDGKELKLGPYAGPPTDHVTIPIGRGVCGTAVASNSNQIVDDVRNLDNYLACNLETRSEIVVLIRHSDTNVILGQIDIDATRVGAFGKSEELFLEKIAKLIAPLLPIRTL